MEKDCIIVGIDASRNRFGGATVHLIGILTEDEAGLAQAIFDLLKDASHRDTLEQEGKRPVGEYVTAERMARDYATLYADILGVLMGHAPVC